MLGSKSSGTKRKFFSRRSIVRSRSGNLSIMAAVLLPCIIGAGGVAMDVSNAVLAKTHLANVADAASLAAASALTDKTVSVEQARQHAFGFARSQIISAGLDPESIKISVDIKTMANTGTGKKYEVAVVLGGKIDTSLTKIFGVQDMDVTTAAKATSSTGTQNSMSMYLVLDRSGSMQASATTSIRSLTAKCEFFYLNAAQTAMYSGGKIRPCYYYRIEVLQDAVQGLLETLKKADPGHKLIRTGADAYSSEAFAPSDLDWGTVKVGKYVDAFEALGGTNSTGAFKEGVDSLLDPMEDTRHKNENGLVPKKYIILMTDGENSSSSDDDKTLVQCKRAKDAGITVYTVGFMLSSASAKSFLLKCASTPATYFDATNGEMLNASFATIAQKTSGGLPLLTN